MRSCDSKMCVHVCQKYFKIGEIVLFAAKKLENFIKINSKMLPRIGHPWFHMCYAYDAGCVMYSYASRRITTVGKITILEQWFSSLSVVRSPLHMHIIEWCVLS